MELTDKINIAIVLGVINTIGLISLIIEINLQ